MNLITPLQIQSAARQAGLGEEELKMAGMAVLTFSKAIIDRMEERCAMSDVEWLSASHHPYAAPRTVKQGTFQGLGVTVLVPPMGASPLASIIEDLITSGIEAVFLVCASWSLGAPIRFGDLVIPAFSVGTDGVSIHYGNHQGEMDVDPEVVDALRGACRALGVQHHVGGNGTCEALYRITPQMAEGFRLHGCLCMDNGEASTLIAVTRELDVVGGVLFQPYIDLTSGWDPHVLTTDPYRKACRLQTDVVLEAGSWLLRGGFKERA